MSKTARVYYNNILAGSLIEYDGGYKLLYHEDYLVDESAEPISLTLPLQKEVYHSFTLFAFIPTAMPRKCAIIGNDLYLVGCSDRIFGKTKIAVGKISVK
ncbi:HipA N-terminal domain-containing protein [Chitinophaga sp. LS1]|uniref:HipA N-terminal domain-containing protein n=1 Tax=Chitinophaga sp. LS1 TaxID=3051176 RepID=UPI002AAAE017|nr:HipA N-terminal domain-containing protein [Chitinophaga sp. LS1]WPV66935.1 HipA N-terminal domain-containing protein [Chitinophaga sp. LS1]